MNKQRWQQIEAAWHAAADADDVEACLADIGQRDPDLAEQVRRLLAADADEENSGGEAIRQYAEQAAADSVPDTLGDYRLNEEIGRGGMGTVYRAERIGGEFEQTVAIKIARYEFDATARERFFRERQILANLNHRNIAGLLGGGTTPSGAPYLVMEYIQGQPVTDYCSAHQLGLRERLDLFMTVCDAVAFAHRHLVVHRDLKPSNILVDDLGQPRLLDFGIAKLIEAEGGSAESTRTELRVLTPNYAAPEQLTGAAISTATDCYALGVLLYELLSGQRPYEVSGQSLRQVEKQILDADITRPSSQSGQSDAPHWIRSLRGDLDNIVLRCMAREPERRYASVEALVSDLRAYLEGRPVAAAPDAWSYRLVKFVGRNRIGVLAGAIVVVTTLAFVLVLARFNAQLIEQRNAALAARQQAEQAAQAAETQSRTASAVTNYLVKVFLSAAPSFGGDKDISVTEALDASIERLEALRDQPKIQAQIAFTLGEVYLSLGRLPESRNLFQRGIDALDTNPSPNRAFLGEIYDRSGDVFRRLDQYQPAREHLTRAMHILETDPDASAAWLADTYNNLGLLNLEEGRLAEAADLLSKALSINETLEGEAGLGLASPLQNLATVQSRRGNATEALKLVERALAIRESHWGPVHPNVASALIARGGFRFDAGQIDSAREDLSRALTILEQAVEPSHYLIGDSNALLGRIALNQGQFDSAREYLELAVKTLAAALGETSWKTQRAILNLSCLELAVGNVELAEKATRAIARQVEASDHPQKQQRLDQVARVLGEVTLAKEGAPQTQSASTSDCAAPSPAGSLGSE